MTNTADATGRVALIASDGSNPAAHLPWLPEAWSAIDGLRTVPDAPATVADLQRCVAARWPHAALRLIDVEVHGGGGFVVWASHGAEVVIHGLAVRREQRNLGYGGEAVERLEASRPDRRFFAAVPRFNGLAVYFWLRVGFRPVRAEEDADRAHDPDFLWMVRSVPSSLTGAMSGP